jgi:hypothetical protein
MKHAASERVSVLSLSSLAAGAIAFAYFGISLADGGSELILVAFFTAVVWWAVIVGLALGILPRSRVPARAIVACASLAGLALFAALSMTWGSDDGAAFTDVLRITSYLGLALFVVLASPRGSARVWLTGLAVGIAVLAAYALASRFEPSLPGGEENIATFLPDASGRLSYPIGYWNALAACMAAGAVLLAWLGAHGGSRIGRALAVGAIPICGLALYMTSSAGGALAAAVGAGVLILLGPARPRLIGGMLLGGAGAAALVLLVRQRPDAENGIPGPGLESQGTEMLLFAIAAMLVVAVLRYALDSPLSSLRVSRGLAIAAAVVAVVGVAGAAVAIDPVEQVDEFCTAPPDQLVSSDAASDISRLDSSGRCQYWDVAVGGFADHPVKGVGAGGYEVLWNNNAPFTRQIRHAHSLWFENLSELGLPGLLLILGFFAPAGYAIWRRPGLISSDGGAFAAAAALVAAGLVSASLEWVFEFPSAFIPTVIGVGLLTGVALYRPARAGAADDPDATVEIERVEPSGRGFGWGVAALAMGWASIIVAAVVFFTEAKLIQSESAAERSELEDAAQDARDAATLQPWSSEPWVQIALLEELSGDLVGAQEALHTGSVRAPKDWRIWLINARFEVGLGDLEGARESLDRARDLNPRAQIFQGKQGIPADEQRFQASLESGQLGKGIGVDQADSEEETGTPETNPKDAGVPAGWSVSFR